MWTSEASSATSSTAAHQRGECTHCTVEAAMQEKCTTADCMVAPPAPYCSPTRTRRLHKCGSVLHVESVVLVCGDMDANRNARERIEPDHTAETTALLVSPQHAGQRVRHRNSSTQKLRETPGQLKGSNEHLRIRPRYNDRAHVKLHHGWWPVHGLDS
jgi:hypothetical protein